jgi:hypothetical protein
MPIASFLYQTICHDCYVELRAMRAENTPASTTELQRYKVTMPAAGNCATYWTRQANVKLFVLRKVSLNSSFVAPCPEKATSLSPFSTGEILTADSYFLGNLLVKITSICSSKLYHSTNHSETIHSASKPDFSKEILG